MRRIALAGLALTVVFIAGPGLAGVTSEEIVLPGATGAEGIATGAGSTFYAGDLFTGAIFQGDLRSGDVDLFIPAPEGGRRPASRPMCPMTSFSWPGHLPARGTSMT